jgi:ureidoglycolate lyase
MQIQKLELIAANPENIVPFGALIDVPKNGQALPVAFYQGSVRVYSPVSFISDEDTEIALASIDPRPKEVRWLERHFKHTQTFIPLAGKPFIMVMSPPTEKDMPDTADAKAFLFDGSAGFMLHVGTWHEFPFALQTDTRVIVLLRHEATTALMTDTAINGEGHSGDLEKKDIQVRLGLTLTVADV